ncbi:hypothetical protein SO802_020200 [Lithocarpus litseifolius]|uniref:Uncharacterized protein n=1 Tax=Lithocarpus litseifolius TaxID=425828 RepID=A0AAW2CB83_9ROSI
MNKMSMKMEMNPVKRLFFWIKVYNLVAGKYTADINTTNKWLKDIYTTNKWNIMAFPAERRKNKGKAPAQGCPQEKRLPTGQPFVMHEEVTYSSGDMVIALQEVLSKTLQFHNGAYSELPTPVKFILDNLQAAFTLNHRKLFKTTLQSLEIHLVNLTAQNEVYESHLANLAPEDEAFGRLY